MASAHVDIKAPRTWALDIVVGVMSVVLVAFLLATMNVRREDANRRFENSTRLCLRAPR